MQTVLRVQTDLRVYHRSWSQSCRPRLAWSNLVTFRNRTVTVLAWASYTKDDLESEVRQIVQSTRLWAIKTHQNITSSFGSNIFARQDGLSQIRFKENRPGQYRLNQVWWHGHNVTWWHFHQRADDWVCDLIIESGVRTELHPETFK